MPQIQQQNWLRRIDLALFQRKVGVCDSHAAKRNGVCPQLCNLVGGQAVADGLFAAVANQEAVMAPATIVELAVVVRQRLLLKTCHL